MFEQKTGSFFVVSVFVSLCSMAESLSSAQTDHDAVLSDEESSGTDEQKQVSFLKIICCSHHKHYEYTDGFFAGIIGTQ